MNAYVARQPIFTRRKKIFGYELLFRDAAAQLPCGIDGDKATATVLDNTFLNIGTETLAGTKKSFINFTHKLLIQKVPLLLPKQDIVVEILESVEPTPELIAACQEIARHGYTFALDDFNYSPEWEPLIALADIIKIDFRGSSIPEIQATLDAIPRHEGMSLLAEKVETYADFKIAAEMGFDLFQGFFFCKPELITGKEISTSELNLMRIIAAVNQADFDFKTLEKIIAPDVSISYKLLRYINSAFFARAQTINSIQQALVYMGESEIRRFVSLIGMANLAKGKPEELIKASCIRGKFCESLARVAQTPGTPAELFTLGIFSLIHAILDQDMERVMRMLPLSVSIKNALAHQTGALIGYLALVEYYEKGQWGLFDRLATALKIPKNEIPALYRQACQWADAFTEPE